MNKIVLFCGLGVFAGILSANPAAPIHVSGRHFVDPAGKCVRLMGPMHSMSPFFSGNRWGWGHGDDAVQRCVAYNQKIFKGLADKRQGSYANMIRLTDDGYWSHSDPLRKAAGKQTRPYLGCDWAAYHRYVEKVLVPSVEAAVQEGLYVIVRPSYNTEGDTVVGDGYNRHLVHEWEVMASHPRLQALAGQVLFELENEPVGVKARNGRDAKGGDGVPDYMQPMVNAIRLAGFKGVILVSGAGYQSWYTAFLDRPIRDPLDNYGFAVHVYSGWYGQSDRNASTETFVEHFLHQVPVARMYPIVVTEVDWSPEKPGAGKVNEMGQHVAANWGTWATASSSKWGKAYIGLLDQLGNVSTLAGAIDTYYEVGDYLKTGKITPRFGGNPECCSQAFFDLFKRWSLAKAETPAERDRNLPALARRKDEPKEPPSAARFRRFTLTTAQGTETDNFTAPILGEPWYEFGKPSPERWADGAANGRGELRLTLRPASLARLDDNPSLLMRPVPAGAFTASVTVGFDAARAEGFAGLVVRAEDGAFHAVGRTRTPAGGNALTVVRATAAGVERMASVATGKPGGAMLKAEMGAKGLVFSGSSDGKAWTKVGAPIAVRRVSAVGLCAMSQATAAGR